MRIKLTHLIIVSLITLTVGFSALSEATAKTCAERHKYFMENSCNKFGGDLYIRCWNYSIARYKHCICMAKHAGKEEWEQFRECGLVPDPKEYGLYVIEIATPLDPTTSSKPDPIIDSGGTSGGGTVYEEPTTSSSYPSPIIDSGGTSGGGSVYEEPTTSSSYPSPIITAEDGVVKK